MATNGDIPRDRQCVVVDAVRTPIGRGDPERGYYRDIHAAELLGICIEDLLRRTGIDPSSVDDVIAGCGQQVGEQGLNVARNAWLDRGLPVEVPAVTINRQCGSAQQAVNFGTSLISSGAQDVVIGCGVEHMGHLPMTVGRETAERYGHPYTPRLLEHHAIAGQGLGAEMIAAEWGLTRDELDRLALRSHQLADRATAEGRFARELVHLEVDGCVVDRDQGIRSDASLAALAKLKPPFREDGVLTAGTSSQISDGAAAVLLTSAAKAEELGLTPRARIVDHVTVGCDPVKMLEGPIPATKQILARNRLALGDIDVVEINEAFASVVGAWLRAFDADIDRVNPNGGAMALGHPIGSTGARLIATILSELERSDGELGLVTMCCGGGLGTGTLLQRL